MFDADALTEARSAQDVPMDANEVSRPMRLLEVYGCFSRARDGAMPAWLQAIVVLSPTEIDIYLAAQAWAEHEPDYLDDLRVLVFEEPPQDSTVFTAADIAAVARYRVANNLVDEPWATSQARLDTL